MAAAKGEFRVQMKDVLGVFTDEVLHDVESAVDEVGEEAAARLKQANKGRTTWKKYPRGWKSTVRKRRLTHEAIIHNATDYRLTHLLEFGHAKRNGGRTKAYPHIADVADWADEELQRRIEEKVTQ